MDKKLKTLIAASVVVVLVAVAVAVGVGIYVYGGGPEESASEKEVAVSAPVEGAKAEDAGPTDEQKAQEFEEFMQWLDEEAAKADEAEAAAANERYLASMPKEEPAAAAVEEAPASSGQFVGTDQAMPRWQSIWADLNLTPEEEARMREGFGLAIGMYMAMSPEQQAAERQRMEDMRIRWEGMDDQEREEASQRIRDRFEDWRASGRVELPELSLD